MATVDLRPEAGPREHPPVSDLALWTAVLTGPIAFLVNLQVNYMLVDWSCGTGNDWALHVTHAVALVVTLAAAWLGRTLWTQLGGTQPDSAGGSAARSRLLAVLGTLGSVLFAVSVVAQWITVMVLGACPRA
jgi:hypothetical protein